MTTEKDKKRWRMILGSASKKQLNSRLSEKEIGMDKTLEALYNSDRRGGLGPSSPNVARWLSDIREYFPTPVVKLLQQDALDRLNLTAMLTEPEMLETVVPDVHLVANLMSLGKLIPEKKLSGPTQQAIRGSLNRAAKNRRPRYNEINWNETIRKNLKHYQPAYKTIVPEVRIGYGRKRQALSDGFFASRRHEDGCF